MSARFDAIGVVANASPPARRSTGARPHKEPADAGWGIRYAQIRDPDGNGVDLFADL